MNDDRGESCNTNSPYPTVEPTVTLQEWTYLLFVLDPEAAAERVARGDYPCPDSDCSGHVGPWGTARTRPVRLLGGGIDLVTPRRGRCRHCDRSHVFVPVRAFPRRTDSVETVWAALIAAANGQGHRPIAHQLGLPPSTVRGWLRRARANAEIIANRANTIRFDVGLSPAASHQRFDSPLATMVHMVGAATAAWKRRFWFPTPTSGPDYTPRQVASVLTGGWLLIANAPASAQFWRPG